MESKRGSTTSRIEKLKSSLGPLLENTKVVDSSLRLNEIKRFQLAGNFTIFSKCLNKDYTIDAIHKFKYLK